MPTLDNPSKSMQTEIMEQELDLEIPVLESVYTDLESLQAAYNAVSNIRNELQTKLDTAIEFSNEQAKLLEQYQTKVSQLDNLKKLLGESVERNNSLSGDLQKRNAEIEKQNEDIKFLREKIKEFHKVQTKLRKAEEDNQALNKELEDQRIHLTTRIEELDIQLLSFNSLQKHIETDKERIAQYEEIQLAELNDLRSTLEQREKQLIELNHVLGKEREEMQTLENEMNSAKTLMQSFKSKIEEANKRVPSLEEEIHQRDQRIASLEGVLNKVKQQVAPLRSDLTVQNARIRELEELFQESKKVVPIDTHKPEDS